MTAKKIYEAIFGKTNELADVGFEGEEYDDIQAYSQNKCVTPNPVTMVFDKLAFINLFYLFLLDILLV